VPFATKATVPVLARRMCATASPTVVSGNAAARFPDSRARGSELRVGATGADGNIWETDGLEEIGALSAFLAPIAFGRLERAEEIALASTPAS